MAGHLRGRKPRSRRARPERAKPATVAVVAGGLVGSELRRRGVLRLDLVRSLRRLSVSVLVRVDVLLLDRNLVGIWVLFRLTVGAPVEDRRSGFRLR